MLSDTLWKLEHLQTLARIQASQFRYWLLQGLLLWLASIVGVMMLTQTGPKADYFFLWVLSSLWPLKSIGWKGQQYATQDIQAWLLTIYGAPFLAWLTWAALVALVPVAVIGGIGWWYVRRRDPHEQHIRGAQILSVEVLAKYLKPAGNPGVRIGPVTIPEALHSSHILVVGATGSGKTVTLRQLLRQIAARGDSAIIMDPEGEFVREFYDESRGDYLLNPLDARFPGWSPWAECVRGEDIDAQAAALFPITPQMQGSPSEFYRRAARMRYRALLEGLSTHDPRVIPDLLAAQGQGKRLSPQEQGILSTLQIATASFRYLEPGPRTWSAREWITDRRGWCFFTARETEKEAVLPFIGLGLDALSRQLLNAEIHPDHTTWMVIDELASLPPLVTLPDLMRRGRKRGVAVAIGFQEVSGLKAIYGEALTDSLLNAPSTRLLLRTNDAETQRWCSAEIGEREVMRRSESQTVGPENVRDSIHRNQQQRVEAAVLSSQFGALPPLRGYLKVGHYGAAEVQITETRLVEHQPAFVPRAQAERGRAPYGRGRVADTVVKEERKRVVNTARRAL